MGTYGAKRGTRQRYGRMHAEGQRFGVALCGTVHCSLKERWTGGEVTCKRCLLLIHPDKPEGSKWDHALVNSI